MPRAVLLFCSHLDEAGAGPDPEGQIVLPDSIRLPAAGPGRDHPERKAGARVRVPPLSSAWTPPRRWRLAYRGLWREREHIAIQELRT
eukprot:13414581-Alexandrium_andersonii.AAC.1